MMTSRKHSYPFSLFSILIVVLVTVFTGVSQAQSGDTPAQIVAPADQAVLDDAAIIELVWKAGTVAEGEITGYKLWASTIRNAVEDPESYPTMLLINGQSIDAAANPEDSVNYIWTNAFFENATYYWRIDQVVGGPAPTTIAGSIWSFTISGPPKITAEPETFYSEAGQDVIFSVVAASNTTNPIYQWYQMADDGEDIALETSKHLRGTTTASLTIKTAQLEDEGQYYCIVSNDKGEITSKTVELVIKRMLGHWSLNGDLQDISGSGNHGIMNTPTFLQDHPGAAEGHSLSLSGLGDYVTISNEDQFDYYKAMTVSFWIKGAGFGFNAGFISKRTEEADGWAFLNSLNLDYILFETGSGIGSAFGLTPLGDDQWHHIVCMASGPQARLSVYVDGLEDMIMSGDLRYDDNFCAPNDGQLVFGSQSDGFLDYPMAGKLSDIRIYNYELSPTQIAQLRAYGLGEQYCAQSPAYDINNDCRVTYSDVATLLSQWLAEGSGGPGDCQNQPTYDLNDDCMVDVLDIIEMADQWLSDGLEDPVIDF